MVENDRSKILQHFQIETDKPVKPATYDQLNIVVVDKVDKKAVLINVEEKLEENQDQRDQQESMWTVKTLECKWMKTQPQSLEDLTR